jgi:hypothetical protein
MRFLIVRHLPRCYPNIARMWVAFSVLSFLGFSFVLPCKGGPAEFKVTGNLTAARQLYTATLLPVGQVLAVGGFDNFSALTAGSAELFDAESGTWTATGQLNTGRAAHSATLLPDGRVLVAGGDSVSLGSITAAELYDPANGVWTTTGSLNAARASHTATLLPNGQVLVTAGSFDQLGYGGFSLDTAELYNPASGVWTTTGSLATARVGHTATLLPNGKVLVAGGRKYGGFDEGTLASAETYDPSLGTWAATTSLSTARDGHTAILLPNGKVLVAGGHNDDFLASAELYDPESDTWAPTASLNTARENHTATLLADGRVLVVGGSNKDGILANAELYDPANGTWTTTDSLNGARTLHAATLLPDGTVLIAGGKNDSASSEALDSAELYVRFGALLNISTRLDVQLGDDVMIGGFIITGSQPETVIVRGIGPSLSIPGLLADPIIDLHDSSGALIASNDNWKDDPNQQQIIDGGLAPTNESESALWQTLDPGAYTVILRGNNAGTGVGLVEVYELGRGSDSTLGNISTRGLVQTDDNVLIGGLIVGEGTGDGSAKVIVRALGPSLPVENALSDPILELHDGSGTLIDSNDDWKTRSDGSSQQAEIEATLIVPTNDLESALVETLLPGSYTAVVRGKDNSVGVGMVEVYNLGSSD